MSHPPDRSEYLQYFRLFYALNFFYLICLAREIGDEWVGFRPSELVEILFWFRYMPFPATEVILLILAPLFSFLALNFIEKRWVRIAAFLSSLVFYGRYNNIDQMDHTTYFYVYPLFLMAVPKDWDNSSLKTVARFCLVSVFVPFSIAGAQKIANGVVSYLRDGGGIFNTIYSFQILIGREVATVDRTPDLAIWSLRHPILCYSMFLAGIVLELGSAMIAWSEKYLTPLALALCLFELGTAFFMDIFFPEALLLCLVAAIFYPRR